MSQRKKPKKLPGIQQYRKFQDAFTDSIPWPNVHPNIISGMQIVFAVAFVLVFDESNPIAVWAAFGLLLLGNVFDAIDGSIARKHGYDLNKGWIVDVTVDRVSEFISFLIAPWWWMAIWAGNLLLSIVGYRFGYHSMLALRIPFLIYFVIVYML